MDRAIFSRKSKIISDTDARPDYRPPRAGFASRAGSGQVPRMIPRRLADPRPLLPLLLMAGLSLPAVTGRCGMSPEAMAPDTVVLNDGTEIRGLILRNAAASLFMETAGGEREISKGDIRRIIDQPGDEAAMAAVTRAGRLPHWHSIVQDFRHHDSVRSFRPVPPTRIDNGFLRNIPYISYRVNETSELNIYGPPDDPVAVELGVYGKGASSTRQRKIMREFLAGHLGSRREVAALYALDLDGGEVRAGRLAMRCTPPSAPDAYGGWWLCIYDPARIEGARVTDAAYERVTRPFEEVNDRNGSLRAQADDPNWLESAATAIGAPWMQGFTRDRQGVLRLRQTPES